MIESHEGLNALQTIVALSWWLVPLVGMVIGIIVAGRTPPTRGR